MAYTPRTNVLPAVRAHDRTRELVQRAVDAKDQLVSEWIRDVIERQAHLEAEFPEEATYAGAPAQRESR